MIGVNGFYDYDLWASHERLGLGFEAKASVFDFNVNMYQKINTSGREEFVMNGLDYQLKSQIPYVHWASVFANAYEWKGIDRDDVKGRKLGGEAQLTPTLSFKAFYDDKGLIPVNTTYCLTANYENETKYIFAHQIRK